MEPIEIKEVKYKSALFDEVWNIRKQVFVLEQGVAEELELDEHEEESVHFLLIEPQTQQAAATLRLRTSPPFAKLERVAVLKNFRGQDYGAAINRKAIEYCREHWPNYLLVAHSQTTAIAFYGFLGGIVVSEEFLDEVSILHHTIMFPDIQRINTYEIWNFEASLDDSYMVGEYRDPQVVANMKAVLNNIRDGSIITMSSLLPLVNYIIVSRGLMTKFVKYGTYVTDNQPRGGQQLKGLFLPKYTEGQMTLDEEFLMNIGWQKLNTGHFSNVDERWRNFYFAVSFVKSIRLKNEGKFEEAVNALDMGLMMGRHNLPDTLIISWTRSLIDLLPIRSIPSINTLELPSPKILTHCVPVSVETADLSEEDFLDKYGFPQIPVVIRGYAKNWKAFQKWNFNYLNNIMGYRSVPIEIGSKYTEDGWAQKIMQAHTFFSTFSQQTDPSDESPVMYLAQHRLLEQIPELKEDLGFPDYCFSTGQDTKDIDINMWIGPGGTVSPLHTDPRDNMFCQISGKKFVRLVSKSDTEFVYPITDGILTNTSQLDVEEPDYSEFSDFEKAKCYDVLMEPGDLLFIPKLWWHYVKSLSPSISASFWFDCEP